MARELIRQSTQIRNSQGYDDTLPSGVALEVTAAQLEQDLNALRSQINHLLGSGHWYDAPATDLTTLYDGTSFNRIVLTEAGTVVYVDDGDLVLGL